MPHRNPHVTAILSGDYGPEPAECPIPHEFPEHRKAYVVPHEHRALLVHIAGARQELNCYQPSEPRYLHLSKVEAAAAQLSALLLKHSGAPGYVVEYHEHWLYSVLTHEDILREHAEFEEEHRPKNANKDVGTLSYKYLEEPPETTTFWDFMCDQRLCSFRRNRSDD